jgi:hypothetical protein
LTKFAFENIIEKGQKSSLFSFYFPIQNLLGILSCPLNKSCRELNSKQLSFLGHFQKMPFCCSKIDLKKPHFENLEKELKNKKKSFFSPPEWAGTSLSARRRKPARPSSRSRPRSRARPLSSGSGARRSPACTPRAVPNPCARSAAWTRRTDGHGRRLAGRSEPLHRDGIASRVALDRALTPTLAPFLLSRFSFLNAATLLATAWPPAIATAAKLARAALPLLGAPQSFA